MNTLLALSSTVLILSLVSLVTVLPNLSLIVKDNFKCSSASVNTISGNVIILLPWSNAARGSLTSPVVVILSLPMVFIIISLLQAYAYGAVELSMIGAIIGFQIAMSVIACLITYYTYKKEVVLKGGLING